IKTRHERRLVGVALVARRDPGAELVLQGPDDATPCVGRELHAIAGIEVERRAGQGDQRGGLEVVFELRVLALERPGQRARHRDELLGEPLMVPTLATEGRVEGVDYLDASQQR